MKSSCATAISVCCHLCTSRHLLCADCACFQSTTTISIYFPSARWAGVGGTVLFALLSFPSPVAMKHLGWALHSARFDYNAATNLARATAADYRAGHLLNWRQFKRAIRSTPDAIDWLKRKSAPNQRDSFRLQRRSRLQRQRPSHTASTLCRSTS